MLTNAMLFGLLDDPIEDNIRYIKVERPYRNSDNKFETDRLPAMYWSRAVNSYFMTAKKGTMVAIRGRLEQHPTLGTLIVCDFLEAIGNPVAE
jgi:hypothetical protein